MAKPLRAHFISGLHRTSDHHIAELTMAKPEPVGRSKNCQQFLQHALDCFDPNCILPPCVNMKLTLTHSQTCRRKKRCTICQEMKSIASKHCEYCVDVACRVPFCKEAKLQMLEKAAAVNLNEFLDVILQEQKFFCHETEEDTGTIDLLNSRDVFLQPNPPQSRQLNTSTLEQGYRKQNPRQEGSSKGSSQVCQMTAYYPPPVYNTTFFSNSLPLYPDESSNGPSAAAKANSKRGSASYQSTMTTGALAKMNPLPVNSRENVGSSRAQQASIDLFSTAPRAHKKKLQQSSQISHRSIFQEWLDHNTVCASESSPVAGTPHDSSPPVVLNPDGIVGTGMEVDLSRVRLMNALCGLMRVIRKTKRREELLICATSLRSALHEIKKTESRW